MVRWVVARAQRPRPVALMEAVAAEEEAVRPLAGTPLMGVAAEAVPTKPATNECSWAAEAVQAVALDWVPIACSRAAAEGVQPMALAVVAWERAPHRFRLLEGEALAALAASCSASEADLPVARLC